jgi:3-(methylthio)propanoyl-CoA dehydrogenase
VSNFYRDNNDILFHIKNMDLSRVIKLKENDFADKDKFAEAPVDVADAVDSYDKVLEIVGDIAGEFIAPRAPEVDKEGAQYLDGEVFYAKGTGEAIERLKKAELMGLTLPRRFGGLNLPKVIYSIAIELISRADAALMNIVGLQDIAETIYKFGSEDQRQRYLPRFARGEVLGSMALTEPDAGSDLQSIILTARERDGQWYLKGVKRFITNGNAQISLVMARSEENVGGGRGISLFIYERDKNI